MAYMDLGVRCDRHVGEAFPPRCTTCTELATEWAALRGRHVDA